jgi:hypothetical protein
MSTICGTEKRIFLGQSEAGERGWDISHITTALNVALLRLERDRRNQIACPRYGPSVDRVVKATPADLALVVVGGQPLYGDPALLAQLLPAGTRTDSITICGTEKRIFLGQSEAGERGWDISHITTALNVALAKANSKLGGN